MRARGVSVQRLLAGSEDRLGLTQATGGKGLANRLHLAHVQRLSGTDLKSVPDNCAPLRRRVVLIMNPSRRCTLVMQDGKYPATFLDEIRAAKIPCIFYCQSERIAVHLRDLNEQTGIPVLASAYDPFLLESRLTGLLREKISHQTRMHGVLMKMFGAGVLIRGDSGAGKTTLGMMLAQRGHLWIADDVVEIRERRNQRLYACGVMAVRDLADFKESGVRDIREVFAKRMMAKGADLRIILDIQPGDEALSGRRSEKNGCFRKIMGTRIPCMQIPSVWSKDFNILEIERRVRVLAKDGGAG